MYLCGQSLRVRGVLADAEGFLNSVSCRWLWEGGESGSHRLPQLLLLLPGDGSSRRRAVGLSGLGQRPAGLSCGAEALP